MDGLAAQFTIIRVTASCDNDVLKSLKWWFGILRIIKQKRSENLHMLKQVRLAGNMPALQMLCGTAQLNKRGLHELGIAELSYTAR